MKQPHNTTIYNTALYLRLSRDDELQGESGSIQTQDFICQGYFLRKERPALSKLDVLFEMLHNNYLIKRKNLYECCWLSPFL